MMIKHKEVKNLSEPTHNHFQKIIVEQHYCINIRYPIFNIDFIASFSVHL